MKFLLQSAFWAFLLATMGCVGVGSAHAADSVDRAFDQAKTALDQGDSAGAIARLDTAIKLAPHRAKLWGLRGVAWLRKGEYAKGSSDLKTAIRLNPDDAGREYPPPPGQKPSADALRHGEQQVTRMLHDRPAMAEHEKGAGVLRAWAARQFAGENLGSLIDWDESAPLDSDAEHIAPSSGEHGAIMVAATYDDGPHRDAPRSFEELWAGAIYELHNITNAKQFIRLNQDADQGKVSKRDFVAGILKYELRAAQQTRAFYVQTFLPLAEKMKLSTDPVLWFCDWWDTPAGALKRFTDKSSYPWRPYARTHDWATVERRWRLGKLWKALGLLQEMRTEKGYEEDEAEVCYWIGRCFERLGKTSDAITAFDESIRIDPNNPAAYRARGELHQQAGHLDKARADFAKAKALEGEEK